MILVSEIWDEARKTFGHCLEPKLYRWITDAVELLASKGEIDPLVGFVDLCLDGPCATLPAEIETVLAVNICGRPAMSKDILFSFHLNGPGDCGRSCSYSWADQGNWPTYKDLVCPSKLIAFLDSPEDAGKMLKVFGFDEFNRPLRTKIGDTWEDGLRVPTVYGYALPSSSDPYVSRITGIVKDLTVANVRLSSFDNSANMTGGSGTLLGVYENWEVKPIYRRIKVNTCGGWIRMCYRKRSIELRSQNDRILLHSRPALLMAFRALRYYDDGDFSNGNQAEANATRLLTERENSLQGPARMPLQVIDLNSVMDKNDYVD